MGLPANEELRERARELYVHGEFGYRRVAKDLGVSETTVKRWVNPGYYERHLHAAREAKRRRTGVCVDCGAPTRYGGKTPGGVSYRCPPCGAIFNGQQLEVWTAEVIIERIREWNDIWGEPPAMPDWNPNKAREMGNEARARRFEKDRRWPWFTQVVAKFGTWNAGIIAAGFEPRVANGGGGNQWRRRHVKGEEAPR